MFRLGSRRGVRIGSALGIGAILAFGLGANTLHAQAVPLPQTTTTTLTSSASPTNTSTYGQDVTLTATVFPHSTATPPVATTAPGGSVQFMDGATDLGVAAMVTPTAGGDATASLTTGLLAAGSHSLTAAYLGDPNDSASLSTPPIVQTVSEAGTTTVTSSSENPSTLGDSVTFTAVVASTVVDGSGPPPGGTVTFSDGGTVIGAGTLDNTGTTTFPTSSLAVGSHPITAAYLGDGQNYAASTAAAVTQVVLAVSTTTLTSAPNPSGYGDSVTLTATVSGTNGVPTGTVTFEDGGTALNDGTVNVTPSGANATATLDVSSLTAGSHSLSAVYSGDPNYAGSTSSLGPDQVVDQASSSVTLVATPSSSSFGDSVTLTATVTPSAATGAVSFDEGGTHLGDGTLSEGVASMSTSTPLSVGSHSITASYAGDANDTAATSPAITETVGQANASNVLSATPNPVVFGNPLTLTDAVGPAGATGTVTFSDGNAQLGLPQTVSNGSASMTISTLTQGPHSITAAYSGNGNFVPSTSETVGVTVLDLSTTVVTSSSAADTSTYGDSVTFTATVAGDTLSSTPTGTVTFSDGANVIGTGTLDNTGAATFTTSALSGGSNSITAVYGGDGTFNDSTSAPLTQTVTLASTTTGLAAAPSTTSHGTPVTLTATVSGSGATGTVTFTDGLSSLGTATVGSDGTATLTTSILAVGSHSITAAYGGDGNYASSASTLVSVTITEVTTSTALVANPNPAILGQLVTITATVSGSGANGTVTFMDGNTNLGTDTLNNSNQAVLSTSSLAVGTHSLSAAYSGDANDTASTGTTSLVVNLKTSTTALVSNHNPSTPAQSVTLTATVTPGATGTVTFSDGATVIGTGTVSSGAATFTSSTLTVGSHSITASYGGDASYSSSTSGVLTQVVGTLTTTGLASSANPSTVAQSVTFTATVAPSSATGTVTFSDGATAIGSPATLASGVATISTSALTQGTHQITAVYSGSGSLAGSTSNTVSQVVSPATADTVTVLLHSHSLRANGTATTAVTATVAPAVAGIVVTWTASPAGSVTFGSLTSTTDGTGVATNSVIAGKAASPNNTKTTVTATEANGSGSDQEKLVGSKFSNSLTVSPNSVPVNGQSSAVANVVDGNGNPVAGELVAFAGNGAAGSPTFATPTAVTDASGNATDAITAGDSSGGKTVTASDNASDIPADNFTQSGILTQVASATNTSFVNAAYLTMLGNDNDSAGIAYWIGQLNNGVSRSTFAAALASSPAYRTNVISGSGINDFYHLYLKRAGEAGGIQYWVNRMAGIGGSQLTFEQVRLQFVGSPEFFSSPLVGNNDKSTAIEALYQDLLNRASDPAGKAYWMANYDTSKISAQFLFSSEGRFYLVDTLYHQILNRTAVGDPGGAYWTNALLNGASDENIIADILGSNEYFSTH